MSNYIQKRNIKDKWEIEIYFLDDCFGHHNYWFALRWEEKKWDTKDLPKFESIEALFKHYGFEEIKPKTKREQLEEWLAKNNWFWFVVSNNEIIDFVEKLYNS